MASRTRSARSAARAISATRARANGMRTPSVATDTDRLTRTTSQVTASRGRDGRKFRRDAAACGGIVDPVVVHPHEHPHELLFDGFQLLQRERRIAQLPLIDPLPHDVID